MEKNYITRREWEIYFKDKDIIKTRWYRSIHSFDKVFPLKHDDRGVYLYIDGRGIDYKWENYNHVMSDCIFDIRSYITKLSGPALKDIDI